MKHVKRLAVTGTRVVGLAQRGLRAPGSLTKDEIESLCASLLRQYERRRKEKKR